MYRIFYVILFCSFSLLSFGQDTGNILTDELDAVESKDRVVFELVQNNWINTPDSVSYKWLSTGFNTYAMYDFALNEGRNVSVAPGIGISINSWYNNSRTVLDETDNITRFVEIDSALDTIGELNYDKNKMTAIYADFHGELRFRTKPNKLSKRFKAGVGFKIGYLLTAYEKYRGADQVTNLGEVKYKIYKLPNINNIRFGLTGRVGYSNFNLVGYYGLSTLFLTDRGPGIQNFSVGISFNSL